MLRVTKGKFYRAILKQLKAVGKDTPANRKKIREALYEALISDAINAYYKSSLERVIVFGVINEETLDSRPEELFNYNITWDETPQGHAFWYELHLLIGGESFR